MKAYRMTSTERSISINSAWDALANMGCEESILLNFDMVIRELVDLGMMESSRPHVDYSVLASAPEMLEALGTARAYLLEVQAVPDVEFIDNVLRKAKGE